MSSARNHAKRSHRSEHFKKASIGTSTRKMWIGEYQKPQRAGLFARFKSLFHRNDSES